MENANTTMSLKEGLKKCLELPKCRRCGCLQETLDGMKQTLSENKGTELAELLPAVETSLGKMEAIEYT